MPRCGRHLVLEPLEQRHLLSIDMVIPGVQDGTPDEFLLVRNGTYLEAWRNASLYDSQLFADVRSVTVNGTSDNDKLTLDLGQGDVVPDEAGIQFTADGQSSVDSLVVDNGSVSVATLTFTGTGAGNLALNGTTTFSGVEPISILPDSLGSLTIEFDDNAAQTMYLRDDTGQVGGVSQFDAGNGTDPVIFLNPSDSLTIRAGAGNDTFTAYAPDSGFDADVSLYGEGGDDTAYLYDGTGNDTFTATADPNTATLDREGSGPNITVNNFDRVFAYATGGGNDAAQLTGSSGNDTFQSSSTTTSFWVTGCYYYTNGFYGVTATAVDGGTDTATLNGGTGNDAFAPTAADGTLTYAGGANFAKAAGFDTVTANGGTGDSATFTGTSAAELFTGSAASNSMAIAGTNYVATGFPSVTANAGTGDDVADLSDGAANDTFTPYPTVATLNGSGANITMNGFDWVEVDAQNGGYDSVYAYDIDTFTLGYSGPGIADMQYARASNFEYMNATSDGDSSNSADLYDSDGNDTFTASSSIATFVGDGFEVELNDFRWVQAYSYNGGYDTAELSGSEGDDYFEAMGGWARMDFSPAPSKWSTAIGFDLVTANANGGNDEAYLIGTTGDDYLEAADNYAQLSFGGCSVYVEGFAEVTVDGNGGTEDDDIDWLSLVYDLILVNWP